MTFAAATSAASTSEPAAARNASTCAVAIACAPAATPPPTPVVFPAEGPPDKPVLTPVKDAHSSAASAAADVDVPAGPMMGPHALPPALSVVLPAAQAHEFLLTPPSETVAAAPFSQLTQCPEYLYDATAFAAHAPHAACALAPHPSPFVASALDVHRSESAHAAGTDAAATEAFAPERASAAHASWRTFLTVARAPHTTPFLSPRTV